MRIRRCQPLDGPGGREWDATRIDRMHAPRSIYVSAASRRQRRWGRPRRVAHGRLPLAAALAAAAALAGMGTAVLQFVG